MSRKHLGKVAAIAAMTVFCLTGCSPEYLVFHPVGPVGKEEMNLIILSTVLVAIVVIPVLVLLAIIVHRYRDKPGNKAPYQPEWTDSKVLEYVWWGIPIIIIGILAFFTTKSTFKLEESPTKNVKPITIQVISLNWKWLFEYPDQKIATVNYVNIPEGVPVQFELTADAPMNSFWVPQLGGQEYTMPGMSMRLWLQANTPGTFQGYGANFTGQGFAHMNFAVKSQSQADFNTWVNQVKSSAPQLTMTGYQDLRKQSVLDNVAEYSSFPNGLFNDVVNMYGGKYMEMDKKQGGINGMKDMGSDKTSMDMNH